MTPGLVLAVLGAGVAGALLRYGAARVATRWPRVPWAVLAVNVVGSVLAGAVAATASADLRLVVVTGFCGGLTTFSTFSVETIELWLHRRHRAAVTSVALNLVLGIGGAALGYGVGAAL